MAKENYISLRGQLRAEPKFQYDEKGKPIMAFFPLLVIRRNIWDRAGNLSIKWDRPIISTADQNIIKEIQKAKVHDIIEVKGTFRTQHSQRTQICPHCGEKNIIETAIQTIKPIYVGIVDDRMKNDTDGQNYLIHCAEIANIAKVIGRVCTNTEDIYFGETEQGELYGRYQLAVNRKLYIRDSEDEEDHADFPVIYSYGDIAKEDQQILKQNTLVYLDGYIHTMIYEQPVECSHCGEEFKYKSQKMNLTPYSMEYLRDFDELLESTHGSKKDIQDATPEEVPDMDKE